MAKKKLDQMTKERIVSEYKHSPNKQLIANRFGVSPRTVGRVLKDAGIPEYSITALSPDEQDLIQHCRNEEVPCVQALNVIQTHYSNQQGASIA